MKGLFILVVGPSGSGKSTLIKYIKTHYPNIVFPPSYTTRAPRPEEVSGTDYFFITEEEFKQKANSGDFLEWVEYGGNYYATAKDVVSDLIQSGAISVKQVEVQGARHIKKQIDPNNLKIVFVDAGSWEELEKRIVERAPIEPIEIKKRKARYDDEMSFKDEANYIVTNSYGKLKEAFIQLDVVMEKILAEA